MGVLQLNLMEVVNLLLEQTQTVNTITSNGARDLKLKPILELVLVSLLKMEALGK